MVVNAVPFFYIAFAKFGLPRRTPAVDFCSFSSSSRFVRIFLIAFFPPDGSIIAMSFGWAFCDPSATSAPLQSITGKNEPQTKPERMRGGGHLAFPGPLRSGYLGYYLAQAEYGARHSQLLFVLINYSTFPVSHLPMRRFVRYF